MRSITFERTNRPFAGARYKRMPYSSAKTAQMNRSIAKTVESALRREIHDERDHEERDDRERQDEHRPRRLSLEPF